MKIRTIFLGSLLVSGAALPSLVSAFSPLQERSQPTPMSHDYLMQAHARLKEGPARARQVRLEHNLEETLKESKKLLQQTPPLDLEQEKLRRGRLAEEKASRVVTRIDDIVRDRKAAIALGKALFWEIRVGSDGQTACATCHYEFGHDNRSAANGLSFGVADRVFSGIDTDQDADSFYSISSLNWEQKVKIQKQKSLIMRFPNIDFNRIFKNSPSITGNNNTIKTFNRSISRKKENTSSIIDTNNNLLSPINQNSHNERQKSFRSSPTIYNAVLYDRLFHDGSARSVFNGYDHLGDDALPDGVGKWRVGSRGVERVLIRLPHAALASQAVRPPTSSAEMSWFGRQFYHIGQKLLPLLPLDRQEIAKSDSVLGGYLNAQGKFKQTYEELVKEAFRPEWWQSSNTISSNSHGECDPTTGLPLRLTQTQANFSLFFGIALMLYEETLISDQTPFDQHYRKLQAMEKGFKPILTASQQRGYEIFKREGCIDCHRGPEFGGATNAQLYGPLSEFEEPLGAEENTNTFSDWLKKGRPRLDERIEKMFIDPKNKQIPYDNGFYSLGLKPDTLDRGIGTKYNTTNDSDEQEFNFQQVFGAGVPTWINSGQDFLLDHSLSRKKFGDIAFVEGAFKTPILRNTLLKNNFFHDGSLKGIDEVISFYRDPHRPSETHRHVHPEVWLGRSSLYGQNAQDLIAFLGALTDDRVVNQQAPFDHPSIEVPNVAGIDPKTGRTAPTDFKSIKAVGRNGN